MTSLLQQPFQITTYDQTKLFNNYNKISKKYNKISKKCIIKLQTNIKNYYNYILKNELKKLPTLPYFTNIKDLYRIKQMTYDSYEYKNYFNSKKNNTGNYVFSCSVFKNKNKKYVYTRVINLTFIEIYEIYYDNILYKKSAIMHDFYTDKTKKLTYFYKDLNITEKFESNENIHNFYFDSITNIRAKNLFNNFHNGNTINYINNKEFLLDVFSLHKKSIYLENIHKIINKYDLSHNFDLYKLNSCKKNSCKKIYNANADIIEYSANYKNIIECSNTKITTATSNYVVKKTFQFIKNTNPIRLLTKFTNEKNKEEITLNENNYILELKINDKKQDLNNLTVYKYAFVDYNNKKTNCIIEMELPRDAKVASDGAKKYRCDKLIPKKVYINQDDEKNYSMEIKIDKCFSVHDNNYIYYIDQLCKEINFDNNLDKVCVPGLHYFLTKENAIEYH